MTQHLSLEEVQLVLLEVLPVDRQILQVPSPPTPVGSLGVQETAHRAQFQAALPSRLSSSSRLLSTPWQHPTLPPGYAYLYGGVGGMGAQLAAAAYGQGLPAAAGYPATHPGIPAPTVAGPTNTTQFQKQAYGSSYGNSY